MKRAVLLILLGLGCVVAGPVAPAEAHARVTGTFPKDGAVLEQPPEYVSVEFEAKPVTVEGDPIAVYAADGRRVDAGDVGVDDGGSMLVASLTTATGALPAGRYEVVYRVVSADTHLIVGSFAFHSRRAFEGRLGPILAASPSRRGQVARGCHDCQSWPHVVAASGLAAATIGSVVRRRRGTARLHPVRVPTSARITPVRRPYR